MNMFYDVQKRTLKNPGNIFQQSANTFLKKKTMEKGLIEFLIMYFISQDEILDNGNVQLFFKLRIFQKNSIMGPSESVSEPIA